MSFFSVNPIITFLAARLISDWFWSASSYPISAYFLTPPKKDCAQACPGFWLVVVLSFQSKFFLSLPVREPAWRLTGFLPSLSSLAPAHPRFLRLSLAFKTERVASLGGHPARNFVLHALASSESCHWITYPSFFCKSLLSPSLIGRGSSEGAEPRLGLWRAAPSSLPPPPCPVRVRLPRQRPRFSRPPPTPPDRTP